MRIRSWAGRHEARALSAAVALVAVVACSAAPAKEKADTSSASRRPESKPAAPAAVPPNQRQILFVGTSLTAGLGLEPDSAYPMLIQRKIDSAGLTFEVVNAGVSG